MMRRGMENGGCASLCPDMRTMGEPFEVPAVRAADIPAAQIIKIDTEGCEREILENLDLSECFALMVEFHRMTDRVWLQSFVEPEYVLARANVQTPDLGVLCYLRADLWRDRIEPQ